MPKGTRVLTGPSGERYRFDPGSLCLELLLTGGPGEYRRYEMLGSGADLVDWLVESRLALAVPVESRELRIDDAELVAIKSLRDTLWRVIRAMAHGEVPASADIAEVNDGTATTPRPRLDPETRRLGWVTPITGVQVLGLVAREAVDLIAGDAARVRECSAVDCQLLFLDTSRSGNRRWCSMERCGNRHKVRAYRAKQDTA